MNQKIQTVIGEDCIITIPNAEEDPMIITTYDEQLAKYNKDILTSATKNFNAENKLFSAYYPNESTSTDTITPETIDELANGIQNSLDNTISANALIRRYITTNDIIGKTYESIESNVNTKHTLSYTDCTSESDSKKFEEAKTSIKKFNDQINVKRLIRESIPSTYAEGTYILCLRFDKNGNYAVDHYPLGIAYISEYLHGGKPVVCIDIKKLESGLKKTYSKNKRNKAIFFENIEADIKNNYSDEVYQAYKNGESVVRLDPRYTGVMRIGNLGRKYGVSPILRALKAALMLENYENTDYVNAKVRAKKILFQKMRVETMGKDRDKLGFELQVKAHSDLMQAWNARTVMVYTPIPQVESVAWVVDSTPDTNSDKINIYRSKIMTTLGIGFIDNANANFSVANISLDQLMRTINSISEQLEDIIRDWYRVLFENENIDLEFLPKIRIIDAEAMDISIKKDLVELLYSKLNMPLESCLDLLGMSVEDEKQKRILENSQNFDTEIFTPHASQYTTGNSSKAGRPDGSENTDKQSNDKQYNKDVR